MTSPFEGLGLSKEELELMDDPWKYATRERVNAYIVEHDCVRKWAKETPLVRRNRLERLAKVC